MKMKKKIKQAAAAVHTLMLTLPAFFFSAQAAVGIDMQKDCFVDFQLDGTFEELAGQDENLEEPVTVRLYKVADVKESGAYLPEAEFGALALDRVNHETTAEEWAEKAEAAGEILEGLSEEAQKALLSARVTLAKGHGSTGALQPGLYLVMTDSVRSPEYIYSFTPYLLSLPGNYYSEEHPDDSWQYSVTVGLKPEQELRYGSLEIIKTLEAYNATLGGADFIFSVEAVRQGKTVYSDVVSLSFDGPGTKRVLIDRLPAGSLVTVTEVYSGSCYVLTSPGSQDTQIQADQVSQAAFSNTYDEENNGGSSIVNRFIYTPEDTEGEASPEEESSGTWTWQQQRDSAREGEH